MIFDHGESEMNWKRTGVVLAVAAMVMPVALRAQEASVWLTTPDRSSLLKVQTPATDVWERGGERHGDRCR